MTKITISCLVLFLLVAAVFSVCGCISTPKNQEPVPSTTQQPVPSTTPQPVASVPRTTTGLTYEEYLRVNPPPPQNVRATLQTDHISLRWDAPAKVSVPHNYSDIVAYYRIYKGTTEKGLSYFATTTGPAFNDYNISGSLQYSYQITAVQKGETESSPSGNVLVKIMPVTDNGLTFEEYRSVSAPAPENLTAAFRGDHVELRWDAPAVASGTHSYSDIVAYYRIYKGTAENNLSYFASSKIPVFNDFNVTANRQYVYQVTAVQQGDLESAAGRKIPVATG